MTQQSMHAASMPNPALQPFGILIGTWNTTGTHGLVPDTILHGRTSFEWLERLAEEFIASCEDQATRKPLCLAAKFIHNGLATRLAANPLEH